MGYRFVGDVEVRRHALDVVVIVETLHEVEDTTGRVDIIDIDRVGGDADDLVGLASAP